MRHSYYLLAICLIMGFSCKKEEQNTQVNLNRMELFTTLIINPGDPAQSNSSIDMYAPATDSVWHDAYKAIHGSDLGTYVNKAKMISGDFWLLAPNDNKIIILNKWDLSLRAVIENINSPQCIDSRYNYVYVGSRDKAAFYVIDKSTLRSVEVPLPYADVTDILVYRGYKDEFINIACNDANCTSLYTADELGNQLDSIPLASAAPLQIEPSHRGIDILCGKQEQSIPWKVERAYQGNSYYFLHTEDLPSDESYSQMNFLQTEYSTHYQYRHFLILAKDLSDNTDKLCVFKNDSSITFDKVLFSSADLALNFISAYYIAPNKNLYIIGEDNAGKAKAIRILKYYEDERLSQIPLKDPNAVLVFKNAR